MCLAAASHGNTNSCRTPFLRSIVSFYSVRVRVFVMHKYKERKFSFAFIYYFVLFDCVNEYCMWTVCVYVENVLCVYEYEMEEKNEGGRTSEKKTCRII